MMDQDHPDQRHSFHMMLKIGEWLLYPALNKLQRNEETIHLEPKAVAVLEILVRNEGKPVSRQELLDQVWADSIVSDDALTQVIIKLRKAFGDDSRKPSYIQTIPKRGYRLLAPVKALTQSELTTKQSQYSLPTYALFVLLAGLLIVYFLLIENKSHEHAVSPEKTEVSTLSEPMTITVLPFVAVGKSQEGNSLALGITSDLTTDLSKLSALRVIHHSGSQGDKVYSRYLVTGNIQKHDQRLKLFVSLIDAETRQQLWSERFESPVVNFFDMQQSVSEKIVGKLSITVSTAEKERLAKRYTRNLDAYENFLSGQTELLRREREANIKAREWYRQAIEHDPAFARAYAGLALSYAADYRNQWTENGAVALKKAREMAVNAQQMDPSIPEVYWVLGYVDTQYKEHERALQALIQAVDLDPSYADAYALMGGINTYIGEPGKSVSLLRQAIQYRPEAGFLYFLLLGRAYFFLGDFDQALINLHETVERNAESLEAHLYIAATAQASGDSETAIWQIHEIKTLEPDFELSNWFDTYPMTNPAQLGLLQNHLHALGL